MEQAVPCYTSIKHFCVMHAIRYCPAGDASRGKRIHQFSKKFKKITHIGKDAA